MRTIDLLKTYFEKCFEPNESGYLYREKGIGQAFQVTRVEHDEFCGIYGRASKRGMIYLTVILFGGSVLSVFVSVLVWPTASEQYQWPVMSLVVAISVATYFAILKRATKRINAALEGRLPVSSALSKDAVTRLSLSKIRYRKLALVPVLSAVLLLPRDHSYDPMHGWGRLIWLPFIGLNLLAVVQAIRKYRIGQTGQN